MHGVQLWVFGAIQRVACDGRTMALSVRKQWPGVGGLRRSDSIRTWQIVEDES